jgi:hypothetical protein
VLRMQGHAHLEWNRTYAYPEVSRLMGLILAVIGTQMIIGGVTDLLERTRT